MGRSSYRKGAAFERRVKEWLEKHGYFVQRSPQSRGPPDLVALKGVAVCRAALIPTTRECYVGLVECKINRRDFSRREREELGALARRLGGFALLAHRGPPPKYEILWEEVV